MGGLFLDADHLGLATDLYQLTMAAGYFANDHNPSATFELFVRRLPGPRSYLVAAGLEQAVHYLENVRFPEEDIAYLRGLPGFRNVPSGFFDYLARFRFTGEVHAMPEGTVVFGHEPILRITAPLMEAQIVETYLLASINFQTMIASKAARIVRSAQGRGVVDFGTRRAHGPQAGVLAARAAYIGGCSATSNVLAARELGIRPAGTSAHAWVMSFDREEDSFLAFLDVYGEESILLVDTYDTSEGVRNAVRAARKKGLRKFRGIRLDSGDLAALSREARNILDGEGFPDAVIVASGDLNEYKIGFLLAAGAPLDLFGVGTELVTSRDAPSLGGVYKLVEVETERGPVGKIKSSADKATYPGRKQIFRESQEGQYIRDTIGAADEDLPGERLLAPVRGSSELPPLPRIRERAADQVARLPEGVKKIEDAEPYPVRFSDRLRREQTKLKESGQ